MNPLYPFIYSSSHLSIHPAIYLFIQPSIYSSSHLSIHPAIYLFIYLFIYLCIYVSIYVSIYLFIYLSMYLSMYLSIYLFIYISIYLSIYPSIYLSIYLCIYPSMYLSICVSIHLCIHLSIYLLISDYWFWIIPGKFISFINSGLFFYFLSFSLLFPLSLLSPFSLYLEVSYCFYLFLSDPLSLPQFLPLFPEHLFLSFILIPKVFLIRECLDDNTEFPLCSPHSIVEVLVTFLGALSRPLLPPELYPTVSVFSF